MKGTCPDCQAKLKYGYSDFFGEYHCPACSVQLFFQTKKIIFVLICLISVGVAVSLPVMIHYKDFVSRDIRAWYAPLTLLFSGCIYILGLSPVTRKDIRPSLFKTRKQFYLTVGIFSWLYMGGLAWFMNHSRPIYSAVFLTFYFFYFYKRGELKSSKAKGA